MIFFCRAPEHNYDLSLLHLQPMCGPWFPPAGRKGATTCSTRFQHLAPLATKEFRASGLG